MINVLPDGKANNILSVGQYHMVLSREDIPLMIFLCPPRRRVGGHINLPLYVRSSVRI